MPKKKGNRVRHPMGNIQSDTPSPPIISIGKRQREILVYLRDHPERFNKKNYSKVSGVPRTTVIGYLELLANRGLVSLSLADAKITNDGKNYLEATRGGVGSSRRECRKNTLSMHYTRYIMPIKDRSKFRKEMITSLKPLDLKEVKLQNLETTYIYLADATIIIHPKQVAIRIHDTTTNDTEEAIFQTMNKAMNYMKLLNKIGLEGDTIQLDVNHWARVESALAEFLSKIDQKYFLDLGNGKKFWIDRSPPNKIEDETNDLKTRERIDEVLRDAVNSTALLSDVDKQKEVIGMMLKLKILQTLNPRSQPTKKPSIDESKDSRGYIG